MGKHTGNLEEIIDIDAKSDPTLDSEEQNEESKYWIHRIANASSSLYFNTNFQNNGLPLILSYEEANKYLAEGKEIVGMISISEFYDDDIQKAKILEKLEANDLYQEDFELQLKEKVISTFSSFFETGLYLPDVYGGDLERTAHQYSPEKMRKIIETDNFGFNSNRGSWDAAIILEIPLDEQDKIIETLPEPIEFGTEYYGIAKISQVVSPKYIKGMVIKFGKQTMFITNDGFVKSKEAENTPTKITVSKEQYLSLLKAGRVKLAMELANMGLQSEVQCKSKEELREMLFARIELDDESIIDILSGESEQLCQFVDALGKDDEYEHRSEYEERFIELMGVDRVIDAVYTVRDKDAELGRNRKWKFKDSLRTVRLARGKLIFESEEFQKLKTREQRNEFIKNFSEHAKYDVEEYYDLYGKSSTYSK